MSQSTSEYCSSPARWLGAGNFSDCPHSDQMILGNNSGDCCLPVCLYVSVMTVTIVINLCYCRTLNM